MTNVIVRARVDAAVKEAAAAVLATIGLTVSDAVRLMLTHVAREKALPFEPLTPNATTISAMKEAERGTLPRFDSVQALMEDLHGKRDHALWKQHFAASPLRSDLHGIRT